MTKEISSREKEIIIGTILGDAHIAMLKTAARLEITHSEKQKEYVLWKHAELRCFKRGKPRLVKIRRRAIWKDISSMEIRNERRRSVDSIPSDILSE